MNFLVFLVHVVVVSSLCSYSLYCFDFAVLSLSHTKHPTTLLYSALLYSAELVNKRTCDY